MKDISISIIIPAYNLSNYISECLRSVLNQSISFNIEIIIVNDGSVDDTEEKINNFKNENKHCNKKIIIISQQNLGLSEARNTGIRNSNGEYILFIDGDDYINKDMLRDMFELAKKEDADIVVSSYNCFKDGEDVSNEYYKSLNYNIYSPAQAVQAFVKDELRGYVWGNLYKRELFEGIYFERGVYFEDMFPNLKLYYKANKTLKMENEYYNYRQGRENAITSSTNQKKFMDSTIQIIKCYNFIKNIPEKWAEDFSLYLDCQH